jgi:hypothetical protein
MNTQITRYKTVPLIKGDTAYVAEERLNDVVKSEFVIQKLQFSDIIINNRGNEFIKNRYLIEDMIAIYLTVNSIPGLRKLVTSLGKMFNIVSPYFGEVK